MKFHLTLRLTEIGARLPGPGPRRTGTLSAAILLVVISLGCTGALPMVSAKGAEQKSKGKKADPGNQKKRGPKPPAAKSSPVTGRSYDDIMAESGPIRRRAWTPRPVVAILGDRLVAIVGGRAHSSVDGGHNWKAGGLVGAAGDEAVAAGSCDGVVWTSVLRSGLVVESRDDGMTWAKRAELGPMSEIPGPLAVEAAGVGPAGAWAIVRGYSEPLPSSALLVCDEGGWRLGTAIPGAAVAAWRSDRHFAAIVGSTVILGGANGEDQTRGATLSGASLNDIAFVNPSTAWIAADGGLVIESNDGGRTWLPRPVLAGQDLDAIGSVDGRVNWVLGRTGGRGNLAVNRAGRPEWKVSLQAVAPLSRPIHSGGAGFVVLDGGGAVWTARDLGGPWTRRGGLPATLRS